MKFKMINYDKFKNMDQDHIDSYKGHIFTKYYDLMLNHHLLSYIDNLNGFQFEHFIAQICSLDLNELDDALITSQSHDFGMDVLYSSSYGLKQGMKYTSIGFQCKHTKGNSIPSQCLGETLEGINYYDLDYGVVITNGLFSSQTQKGYKQLDNPKLILMDRDKLLKFVREILLETNIQVISNKVIKAQVQYECDLGALKCAKNLKRKYDVKGKDMSTLINNSILKDKPKLKLY